MSQPFPFGFPAATAGYLALYVLTLAVHVLFMSYALAGSFVLAVGALLGGKRAEPSSRRTSLRGILSDWLPFSLGLAITAGVAPLLFLQILYEQRIYTANLLLFHRWMMIVPALITGFYLLYLLKSDFGKARPWLWRLAAVAAFVCFGFTAWSWTENHLLSRDAHAWVETYASGHLVYRTPETLPRLMMWFFGAVAVMAVPLGWQVRYHQADDSDRKLVAKIALGGLTLGCAAAAAYGTVTSAPFREVLLGPLALPYVVATALGGLTQGVAWLLELRVPARRNLVLASVGMGVSLVASGAVRESLRISAIDIVALYPLHAKAAESSGVVLFVAFLLINGGIVWFALRLGASAARRPAKAQQPDAG